MLYIEESNFCAVSWMQEMTLHFGRTANYILQKKIVYNASKYIHCPFAAQEISERIMLDRKIVDFLIFLFSEIQTLYGITNTTF